MTPNEVLNATPVILAMRFLRAMQADAEKIMASESYKDDPTGGLKIDMVLSRRDGGDAEHEFIADGPLAAMLARVMADEPERGLRLLGIEEAS